MIRKYVRAYRTYKGIVKVDFCSFVLSFISNASARDFVFSSCISENIRPDETWNIRDRKISRRMS